MEQKNPFQQPSPQFYERMIAIQELSIRHKKIGDRLKRFRSSLLKRYFDFNKIAGGAVKVSERFSIGYISYWDEQYRTIINSNNINNLPLGFRKNQFGIMMATSQIDGAFIQSGLPRIYNQSEEFISFTHFSRMFSFTPECFIMSPFMNMDFEELLAVADPLSCQFDNFLSDENMLKFSDFIEIYYALFYRISLIMYEIYQNPEKYSNPYITTDKGILFYVNDEIYAFNRYYFVEISEPPKSRLIEKYSRFLSDLNPDMSSDQLPVLPSIRDISILKDSLGKT